MNSDTMSYAESDQLDCQEAADMLSAYALEILDPAERTAVARHLATCRDCRSQLEREEAVVSLLGSAVPAVAPPPSLRTRLLAEIDATSPVHEHVTAAPPPPIPLPPRRPGIVVSRMAATGLALVASLLVIGLVASGVLLYQARDARDQAQSGQAQLVEYLRQGGTLVALAPAGGGSSTAGNGSLVIERSGQDGMLVVGDMKPVGTNEVYKVWASRGNERWSVGELTVNANGTGWKEIQCPKPLTWYDTVGVTLVASNGEKRDLLTAAVPQEQR